MSSAAAEYMEVVAGILRDPHGRVLLASRPPGKSFAGRWEFPGGKVDAGESAEHALVRELEEELGVTTTMAACRWLLTVTHCYPGASRGVRIAAYAVSDYDGVPNAREGQSLAWHECEQLCDVDILEADRPIVTALRLGANVDPQGLPHCRVYSAGQQVQPASKPSDMVGVILEQTDTADAAKQAGADFFLLTESPDLSDIGRLKDAGLPWYLAYPLRHPSANGTWINRY